MIARSRYVRLKKKMELLTESQIHLIEKLVGVCVDGELQSDQTGHRPLVKGRKPKLKPDPERVDQLE